MYMNDPDGRRQGRKSNGKFSDLYRLMGEIKLRATNFGDAACRIWSNRQQTPEVSLPHCTSDDSGDKERRHHMHGPLCKHQKHLRDCIGHERFSSMTHNPHPILQPTSRVRGSHPALKPQDPLHRGARSYPAARVGISIPFPFDSNAIDTRFPNPLATSNEGFSQLGSNISYHSRGDEGSNLTHDRMESIALLLLALTSGAVVGRPTFFDACDCFSLAMAYTIPLRDPMAMAETLGSVTGASKKMRPLMAMGILLRAPAMEYVAADVARTHHAEA